MPSSVFCLGRCIIFFRSPIFPLSQAKTTSLLTRFVENRAAFILPQVAAKIAEADLLRHLQEAAAVEADLRHTLRRRDIRIEELKRDRAAADQLARSSGGTPWSILAKPSTREATACNINAVGGTCTDGDRGKARSAKEQAAKDVAMAATVKRFKLELAEAAARGDVGEAATRKAEELALRLISESSSHAGISAGSAADSSGMGCRFCSRRLTREGQNAVVGLAGSRVRGASVFTPSMDVEHKPAAAVAAVTEERYVECGKPQIKLATPTAVGNLKTTDEGFDLTTPAALRGGGTPPIRGRSMITCLADGVGLSRTTLSCGQGQTSTVVSQRLSTGVRSLEMQLSRLEAVASCRPTVRAADAGFNGRVRSASPAKGRPDTAGVAWAGTLRELRAQLAGLRDKAVFTEQLFNVSAVIDKL